MIAERNIDARMEFARNHLDWGLDEWSTVLFSDESKLYEQSGGIPYIRRRRNEVLPPRYWIPRRMYHGGMEIMVWGFISYEGPQELRRIEGRLDAHSYLELLHSVNYHGLGTGDMIWQQDNAPVHRARIVNQWMNENWTWMDDWPAQSPDLSPIENCWAYVKDQLWRERGQIRDIDEMWEFIMNIWMSDRMFDMIPRLYNSMSTRMGDVLRNRGGLINY